MSDTLSISMRPRSLDEFVGSAGIVTAIKKQLDSGRIPTGWLFHGPSGTGKTTLALIIARLVQGQSLAAEDEVECQEENAADNGKVADARRFAQEAEYMPRQGRYRVLIMDEMQQATPEAQNVFLKLLEVENKTTIYVFCTTDPSKIIPTLRSRCFSLRLQPLDDKDVQDLVVRGWKTLAMPEDRTEASKFITALVSKEVRSPRDILMSLERFAAGMTVHQAVYAEDDRPEYGDIAKAVIRGDWNIVKNHLKMLRTSDVRGLRAVLSTFLRNELLNGAGPWLDDVIAVNLMRLQTSSFEDGVALGATVGLLFIICKAIKEGKK